MADKKMLIVRQKQKSRKPSKIKAFGDVSGVPERIRTAGLPLRRWTQCIYSLSTEIKKMQLYQGISPHSL